MSHTHDLIQKQIGNEFAASQQYVAFAVWLEQQALPQLAGRFYAQAVEERNHALMLVDREVAVTIPGVPDVRNDISSVVELVELALQQERRVTGEFEQIIAAARADGDYLAEQFTHWFLKEQVEEVASMGTLLQVAKRVGDNLMLLEDYLVREASAGGPDPTAPTVAGGAL
jgi:bacterioferritin B